MAWLKKTLLASDASFKILISPTPLIGPDSDSKTDNHTNVGGFQYEAAEFFKWSRENGLLKKGFYIICGDRHWQYQSIHPSGFEEFSCGALVDANAFRGIKPGDKKSTDPDAKIKQPFISPEPSGGFLEVVITPDHDDQTATATFNFRDELGTLLFAAAKQGRH